MTTARCFVTGIIDAQEPVSVDRVKVALRITESAEDPIIAGYITSAREMIEQFTGRDIRKKTRTASFDTHGAQIPWWDGVVDGAIGAMGIPIFELPWCPLVSVQAVRMFDQSDISAVAPAQSYRVDTSTKDMRGRVILRNGFSWPQIGRNQNGVEIDFTSGYETADMPSPLVLAIQMLAAHFYTNRGDCGSAAKCVTDAGIMPLVHAFRVERVTA